MPERITRTIQWYGLIRLPDDADINRIHWIRLSANMIRRPYAEYRNDGVWQPPRGFWGNVVSRRDKRRLNNWQLEFTQQLVMEYVCEEAFLHQAISCQLDATLQTFQNLANALPIIFPFPRFNPIRDWQSYRLIPDEFSIKMQSENAIGQFDLEWDYIPSCSVDLTPPTPPPPPPEPPLEEPIPPDGEFPSQISPPYEGPDDGGETYNPDGLEPPPDEDFPVGNECQEVQIFVEYFIDGAPGDPPSGPFTANAIFFGPVLDAFLGKWQPTDETNSIVVLSSGRIDIEQCNPGSRQTIIQNNVSSFTITGITVFN